MLALVTYKDQNGEVKEASIQFHKDEPHSWLSELYEKYRIDKLISVLFEQVEEEPAYAKYELGLLDEVHPYEDNGISVSFKSNLWCQWTSLKEEESSSEQVFVLFMKVGDEIYYTSGRPEGRYEDIDAKRQFINELEMREICAFFGGYYLPCLMTTSLTKLNLDTNSSVKDIAKTLVEAVFIYKTLLP